MYIYLPVCTVCVAQDDVAAKISSKEFNDNNDGS